MPPGHHWRDTRRGEIFYTLKGARIVIESWRRHYNTVRPHAPLATSRRLRALKPLRRPHFRWRRDRP
jgi:Integrase core domain